MSSRLLQAGLAAVALARRRRERRRGPARGRPQRPSGRDDGRRAAGRGLRRSGLRQQRRRARRALGGWADFARCPPDAAGLHEVAFAFAPSPLAALGERWEGTKVAGHPVIPSLLIDDQGVVQGIRIVTDPEARLYLKKKAFLLGIRVMGRYGRDGWTCTEAEPGDGRTPVGGMFIDRRCEKVFHDRRLILETDLYRTAEQQGREFTDATRLEIFKIAG